MSFVCKLAFWRTAIALLVVLSASEAWSAVLTLDELNDIGYTALERRLAKAGVGVPTGRGVPVTHIETSSTDEQGQPPLAGSPAIRYMPDATLRSFIGKRIVDRSLLSNPPGATSGHATNMGLNFYGSEGLAPGITRIDCFFSSQWIVRTGLRIAHDGEPPFVERNRIQNHSWIGTVELTVGGEHKNYDQEILARFDLQLARDNVLAAVGITHDETQPLLGRASNPLAVGKSLGGAARPDLVAPATSPSVATSWVSATAALLLEASQRWKDSPEILAAAGRHEVLRAAILAGATKAEDEFAASADAPWSRTAAEPLSPLYGAGELQIDHSHRIYTAGRQTPGATTVVGATGWDWRTLSQHAPQRYYFDVERGDEVQDLSIIATWDRQIDPVTLEATLANVDLKLYDADRNFVLLKIFGTGIDDRGVSAAAHDNIEHLFIANVPPGRYALEVTTDRAVDVAIAWDVRPALDDVAYPRVGTAVLATWIALACLLSVFILWAAYTLLRARSARQLPRSDP